MTPFYIALNELLLTLGIEPPMVGERLDYCIETINKATAKARELMLLGDLVNKTTEK